MALIKGKEMKNSIKITQHGSTFTMDVTLETGAKERWTYHREEHNGLVSYSMVDREDL